MALVPWPDRTDPAAQDLAAQSVAHIALGDAHGARATALRLGPVVALMVGRYAPDAPEEIQDEALYRVVGWLAERNPDLHVRAGGLTIRKRRYRDELGALKYSGAASLLNPYRVRRAGKVSA